MKRDELADTLWYLSQCVRLAESIKTQPCCGSCGKSKTCEYRPDWGEHTRINCPLWVKEGEQDDKRVSD